MNNKCRCGGVMRFYGENWYYFSWRCSTCFVIRTQRKRQPKKFKEVK